MQTARDAGLSAITANLLEVQMAQQTIAEAKAELQRLTASCDFTKGLIRRSRRTVAETRQLLQRLEECQSRLQSIHDDARASGS